MKPKNSESNPGQQHERFACRLALPAMLAAWLMAAGISAQTLTNGGFELPDGLPSGGSLTLTNGDSRLVGWAIGGTGLTATLYNGMALTGFPPVEGSYHLAFNGNNGPAGMHIRQTFDTVVGQSYLVTFFVGRMGSGAGAVSLQVAVRSEDGTTLNSRETVPPSSGYGVQQRLAFVATSARSVLEFLDTSTSTYAVDITLDAVSVFPAALGCVARPSGLVGFWSGDGNFTDLVGTTNGTPVGEVSFAPGVVGQAFELSGANGAINLGNPTALQLQTFTIEAWVRRKSTTLATLDNLYLNGAIVQGGGGCYGFYIKNDGTLGLTQVFVSSVDSSFKLTDLNWHHVAVSKSSTGVTFFLDGVAQSVGNYNPTFQFLAPIAIGARGGDWAHTFYGAIDEVSIYNRALTMGEIQAIYYADIGGKCKSPFFIQEPSSQVGFWGKSVSFTAAAASADPVGYQWEKDGISIEGATNATLTVTNLQLADAGSYQVTAINTYGSTLSRAAILTMNPAGVSVDLFAGVTIDGVVGYTYGIQYSTNLSDTNSWRGMTNVTLAVPVQLWFDLQPAKEARRFYRVVPGPILIP